MPALSLQQYLEAKLRTIGEHRVADAIAMHDGSVAGAINLGSTLFGHFSGGRSEDFALQGTGLTYDRIEGLIKSYYTERGFELRRGHEIGRNSDLVAIAPDGVQDINLSVSSIGVKALITVFKPEKRA